VARYEITVRSTSQKERLDEIIVVDADKYSLEKTGSGDRWVHFYRHNETRIEYRDEHKRSPVKHVGEDELIDSIRNPDRIRKLD